MATSLIMEKHTLATQRHGAPSEYAALVPAYKRGEEIINKLKTGMYKVTIKKSRNPAFHRLSFAFLKDVFDYQNEYTNMELLRKQLSIDAGYYDSYEVKGDKIGITPKSWAFDELDELKFHALMAQIVRAAITRFNIPGDAPFLPDIFVEDI